MGCIFVIVFPRYRCQTDTFLGINSSGHGEIIRAPNHMLQLDHGALESEEGGIVFSMRMECQPNDFMNFRLSPSKILRVAERCEILPKKRIHSTANTFRQ